MPKSRTLLRMPASNLLLAAVTTGLVLTRCSLGVAQSVGPEVVVRDPTLAGFASDITAAFDSDGTYIAWWDDRTEGGTGGDIFVQKLGPDGTPLWATDGLAVSTAAGSQSLPSIAPDGAGGAVFVWLDNRGASRVIAAQRVSASGAVQWAENGVGVGYVYGQLPRPLVYRASSGEFIVTWWDSVSFFLSPSRYVSLAQKLDGDGNMLWDPDPPDNTDTWGPGIEVLDGVTRGRSVSDGAGGVLAFAKIRQSGGFRFQHVLADGSLAWPDSVDLTASLPDNVLFNFAEDGAGGVVVAYLDSGTVRAGRVTSDGTLPWSESASTLTETNVVTSQAPIVASDGNGGAFVAWISTSPRDIHVQHVAADGAHLWPEAGAVVPDLSGTERDAAMVGDGAGGLFLSFETSSSLRAQQLDSSGVGQWKVNGSNGLNLMSGFDPIIGIGASGPVVVYDQSFGLSARTISLPERNDLRLTGVVILVDGQLSLTLNGGDPDTDYDVFRTTVLGAPLGDPSWTLVGTIRSGETWIETDPPSPTAFYGAAEH